jgi:hypothetical protein
MNQKDQVFVVNVVVIDLTQEMMASNGINQLANAIVKLGAIVKIYKSKWLQGHHFILMAMEVHGAPRCDMDHFIKECDRLFMIDD